MALVKWDPWREIEDKCVRYTRAVDANLSRCMSSVIMRVKSKLQKDKKLKERLSRIESNILKGQT